MFDLLFYFSALGFLLVMDPEMQPACFSPKKGILRNAVRDAGVLNAELWLSAAVLCLVDHYGLAHLRPDVPFPMTGFVFTLAAFGYARVRKRSVMFAVCMLFLSWAALDYPSPMLFIAVTGIAAILFQMFLLGLQERFLLVRLKPAVAGIPSLLFGAAVISLIFWGMRLL